MKPYAVVIPVYGEEHLTWQILDDLEPELDLVDIFVVDNKGNFEDTKNNRTKILRSDENLRWTRGTNYGWYQASQNDYAGYFLMNNDIRLSPNFIEEMITGAALFDADILGPMYDDVWPQQKNGYIGAAWRYKSRNSFKEAKFVDGTCMYVGRRAFRLTGYLDAVNFGVYGWGADISYCLKARERGLRVAVTERAYINHLKQATAKKISDQWEGLAGAEYNSGMEAVWGPNWRELAGV